MANRGVCWVGVEPVPMEVPSNHLIESSLDVSDESKPQQQQQQQQPMSDSRQSAADTSAAAVAVTPLSTSRRGDGASSRADYMTSPTATPVANGLIR